MLSKMMIRSSTYTTTPYNNTLPALLSIVNTRERPGPTGCPTDATLGETARNNSLRSTGLEVLQQSPRFAASLSHGDKRRGAYTNGGPGTSYITFPCFRKMQEAQIHPLVRVTSGVRNRSFFPYASGVRTSSPVTSSGLYMPCFWPAGFKTQHLIPAA